MAHPKLATAINRSLLVVSTAALVAGPLAAAGAAASLDAVTETTTRVVEDLTCEEALETKDLELIAEFCEVSELTPTLVEATEEARAEIEAREEAAAEAVDEATGGNSGPAPAPAPLPEVPTAGDGGPGDEGGDGGGDSDGSSPTGVLPSGSTDDAGGKPREVRNSGEQPRGIDGGTRGEEAKTNGAGNGGSSHGYTADGPNRPGLYSNSSLTLQPFAAPLVTGPAIYDLPQVAQQLFGLDEAATATDPLVAAAGDPTSTNGFVPTGFTTTPADASGWLAATATGLIMLVGAAHALSTGRTPKRQKA